MMSEKTTFLAQYGSPEHIDSLIKTSSPHDVYGLSSTIAGNPHHTKENIDSIFNKTGKLHRSVVATSPHITTEHLNSALKHTPIAALRHPKLDPSEIEEKITDRDVEHRTALAENPSLTSKHIDKFLESENKTSTLNTLARHPSLTPEHLDKLVKHPNADSNTSFLAANHPNISPKTLGHLADKRVSAALQHPNLPLASIEKHLDTSSEDLVRNPSLNQEHLDRILSNPKFGTHVIGAALLHQNVSKKALNDYIDKGQNLQFIANNKYIDDDTAHRLMNSPHASEYTNAALAGNRGISSGIAHKLIDTGSRTVDRALIHNPSTKKEHMVRIAKDPVNKALINSNPALKKVLDE